MGLVDDIVFRERGASGCSNSSFDFGLTTCCERVGVLDSELSDFYWDCAAPNRYVSLLEHPDCPFCGAVTWSLDMIDSLDHVPEHWRWACDGQPRPGRRIVRPLSDHVAQLLDFCRRATSPLPPFDAMLFLHIADPRVSYQRGWVVERGGLQSLAELGPVFDRLLVAGYSWINLSAYGIFQDNLVIGVELPHETVGVPAGLTSVNYSCPSRNPDGSSGWELNLTVR